MSVVAPTTETLATLAVGVAALNLGYGRLRVGSVRGEPRWFGCLAAPATLLVALRYAFAIAWIAWLALLAAALAGQWLGRFSQNDRAPAPVRWRLAVYGGLAAAALLFAGPPATVHAADGHAHGARQGGFERLDVNEPAAPFVLIDQNGRRATLADFRGRTVVMTFLYTSCTDICPLLVHTTLNAEKALDTGERARVRFVGVTVDPARDTPTKLKTFMKQHGLDESRWRLLTGDAAVVTQTVTDYGVVVRPAPRGDFVHNSVFIVIDGAGVERTEFHGVATPPSAIVEAVRAALREPLARRREK